MNTIEKTKRDLDAARSRSANLSKELADRIDGVRKHYNPKVFEAKKAVDDAKAAHDLALSQETPDHPWTGKTVEGPLSHYWKMSETVRGVVFVYRPGVDLGRGHTYTRPEIGDAFVRLLKKDGKPGAKSVSLHEKFKLIEE